MVFNYTTSDEDMDMDEDKDIAMLLMMHKNKKPKHGGLVMGREYIWRKRVEGHAKLMDKYFVYRSVFLETYFRRRFRMSSDFFKHIAECVQLHDKLFEQRRNCVRDLGHSLYQKVTAALQQMAYGIPVDLVNDHLAMSESQSIKCLRRFAVANIESGFALPPLAPTPQRLSSTPQLGVENENWIRTQNFPIPRIADYIHETTQFAPEVLKAEAEGPRSRLTA
ncbi:hypothetical protein D1007_01040 [Hordeum vulgare]|nr:hypothetical protein D1007_01040 [Hordeum vulgare]